ncbi:MAG: mannose-1-phosphate guanylyltransferase [Armatimonadetes bacterium]|nr:mannose-1-phosphate guanylyltransferase [Armatimonadota bacterium]
MIDDMRVAVIMAGGSGERFWPLSRKRRPKQLLRLTDPEKTMLHEAVDRIAPLVGAENVYIATAPHLAEPIHNAGIVPVNNVFAEPDKRNTLGCLAWVSANFLARGHDEISIAILTADHKIEEPERFRATVDQALSLAESTGGLVTMGITPTRPETGYGYIEGGEEVGKGARKVVRFREKPDLETAKSFVESGNFFWNSGMFFWTQKAFLSELSNAEPSAHDALHLVAGSLTSDDHGAATDHFRMIPNLSIDYALMEKAKDVYVVQAQFPWDDVGAFDSLFRTMPVDLDGNVVIGNVSAKDCNGCVLYNDSSDRVLAAVGMKNVIMVQTGDAVLVAPAHDAQRVKELVAMIDDATYL